MVGPAEPGKGCDVGGTNEDTSVLAGVERLAAEGFQQHCLLLALKHLDHSQHFLCLVAKQEDQTDQSLLLFTRQRNLRT